MAWTGKDAQTFQKLCHDVDYWGDLGKWGAKASFARLGRKFVREIARLADLAPGSYKVTFNAGGPGVSGEILLRHEGFLLEVSDPCMPELRIRYQFIDANGRRGNNQYYPWHRLDDAQALAKNIANHLWRVEATC